MKIKPILKIFVHGFLLLAMQATCHADEGTHDVNQGQTEVKDKAPSTSSSNQVIVPQSGEIRLYGRVISVNRTKGNFIIEASSFMNPSGRSQTIKPSKRKFVQTDGNTQFTSMKQISSGANQPSSISLSTLNDRVFIVVIGKDNGTGKSLFARLVAVDHVETTSVKKPPSQKANNSQQVSRTIKSPKPLSKGVTPQITSRRFQVKVNGRTFTGSLVQANLDTVRIKVGLGHDRVGGTESLASMATRYHALAGINGSYFQAYNRVAYKPPVMTLITNGKAVFKGGIGSTLGFTAQNDVRIDRATAVLDALNERIDSSNGSELASFWQNVQEAVGCGPRLVTDGRITVNIRDEGFSDPKVTRLSTGRSAVGITRDRKVLLVTTSGTISQLAGVMKSLGAYQAMNLDGGASSGLWHKGHYLHSPGRALSNCLLILPR